MRFLMFVVSFVARLVTHCYCWPPVEISCFSMTLCSMVPTPKLEFVYTELQKAGKISNCGNIIRWLAIIGSISWKIPHWFPGPGKNRWKQQMELVLVLLHYGLSPILARFFCSLPGLEVLTLGDSRKKEKVMVCPWNYYFGMPEAQGVLNLYIPICETDQPCHKD